MTTPADPIEAEALCPNCLTANRPRAHFCRQCTAPHSSMATMDPLWSVRAEGLLLRKVVDTPRSWMTLAGIWLLFGSQMAIVILPWVSWRIGVAPAVAFQFWTQAMSVRESLLQLLFGTPLVRQYGAILWFTTRNYFRSTGNETAGVSQL